jgi:hypothetical protein
MKKFIKRIKEGEYHDTHFIMWQFDDTFIRLFFNIFGYQILFGFRRPYFSFMMRKQFPRDDSYRSSRYI